MSQGESGHYKILDVHRRHFLETSELAGLSRTTANSLVEGVIEAAPTAIEKVVSKLPDDFPEAVAASIAEGIEKRVAQLAKERTSANNQAEVRDPSASTRRLRRSSQAPR